MTTSSGALDETAAGSVQYVGWGNTIALTKCAGNTSTNNFPATIYAIESIMPSTDGTYIRTYYIPSFVASGACTVGETSYKLPDGRSGYGMGSGYVPVYRVGTLNSVEVATLGSPLPGADLYLTIKNGFAYTGSTNVVGFTIATRTIN